MKRVRIVLGSLFAILLLAILLLLVKGAIPQDATYHSFADERSLLGIPNAWNTVSNAAFFFAGAYGIFETKRCRFPFETWERTAYFVFFFGVLLTALGSGYYHLAPSTPRLFWDRLPMTLGFTSFFSLWVGERVSLPLGKKLLGPLLLLGVVSMIYWRLTEEAGHGDLRLYGIVQFFPILATPLLLTLPGTRPEARYIGYLLGFYSVAKVLESYDAQIWALTQGAFGGHALKHIAAAFGALAVALRVRTLGTKPLHFS
jgi:Ceramidase